MNPISDQRKTACDQILRKLLLHKRLTRTQISEQVGLAPPTVTNHTRWLLGSRLIHSQSKRVPGVKRPVEELWLNPDCGMYLAARLSRNKIEAELLRTDATVIEAISVPVLTQDQRGVMAALSEAVTQATKYAKKTESSIDYCGLAVFGEIASIPGIIFKIEGIDGWQACQPGKILPALQTIPTTAVWTEVMCKLFGLSTRTSRDHHLGYAELTNKHFHIATMQNGRVDRGLNGTSSADLHQQVTKDGSPCYCGRQGCLAAYLEQNELDSAILSQALRRVFHQLDVDYAGLEWDGKPEQLKQALRQAGVTHTTVIKDPDQILAEGLRRLTVESALHELLEQSVSSNERALNKSPVLVT